MLSMSTSRDVRNNSDPGFSVIELIIGLALTVCLAVAVAPLWLSLLSAGAHEGDQTVRMLQGRVAAARFERDLRLASAAGCPFDLSAPVLEASPSQVVFLERPAISSSPILVEWEIVDGSVMRRWGQCPATRPASYVNSLYLDHKTMLEGVQDGSAFAYVVCGVVVPAPVMGAELASVEGVILDLRTKSEGARSPIHVAVTGRVGR